MWTQTTQIWWLAPFFTVLAVARAIEGDADARAIADVTADWQASSRLAPGIEHRRWKLSEPRKISVNAVRDYLDDERQRGVPIAVAIKADAFSLTTAFDSEDPTDILGLAVSAGEPVSRPSGSPRSW